MSSPSKIKENNQDNLNNMENDTIQIHTDGDRQLTTTISSYNMKKTKNKFSEFREENKEYLFANRTLKSQPSNEFVKEFSKTNPEL
jgi:hypothetical protein